MKARAEKGSKEEGDPLSQPLLSGGHGGRRYDNTAVTDDLDISGFRGRRERNRMEWLAKPVCSSSNLPSKSPHSGLGNPLAL